MGQVRRVLRALRLDKIAAVDFPCQEHATAGILKRADLEALWKAKYSTDQRKEMADKGDAMSDGSYPIADATDLENAVHAVGRGRNNSHAAIRAHIATRAKSLGLSDKLPETWGDGGKMAKGLFDALRKYGLPIAQSDEDEGAETFNDALSDQQLTEAFWQSYYAGTQALEASLLSILKDEAETAKSPLISQSIQQFAEYIETILPGEIGKALASTIVSSLGDADPIVKGVPEMDEIKKFLGLAATATEADVLKALDDRKTELAKATEELEKAKAKKPGEDDNDGDEAMVAKALADGSAFRTPEGVLITKAAIGDGTYAVLKSQNDRLVKQEVELAKARDRDEESTFAKRASDIGFQAEFGSVMRKAYQGDAAAQVEIEKRFKALNEQVDSGELFKAFGHKGADDQGAAGEFAAKVAEVKKANPNLSDAQAYSRVYSDRGNRDIVKRMRAEAA